MYCSSIKQILRFNFRKNHENNETTVDNMHQNLDSNDLCQGANKYTI